MRRLPDEIVEQAYNAMFGTGGRLPEPREPISDTKVEEAHSAMFEDPNSPYGPRARSVYDRHARQELQEQVEADRKEKKPLTSEKIAEAYTRMFA